MCTELDDNAKNSARRRSNCNIHHNVEHQIQRPFITLYPDSYIRSYRHVPPGKFELLVIASGALPFLMLDENGSCTERHERLANGRCRVEFSDIFLK